MDPFYMSIAANVLGGVTLAAVLAVARMFASFAKEQRAVNERNREFERSMQRSQIIHAFQRHVEDGKPMSLQEAEHLDACYQAYHDNGGNGTATAMYEKVKKFAVLVTKVSDE